MASMNKSQRQKLLREIGTHCFAAYELMLFLDTHPNDKEALKQREKHLKECNELKEEYEVKYGPISASDLMPQNRWTWIDDPWPWNNEEDED